MTTGDWHQSAIQWDTLHFKNTETAFFKDYGIEFNSSVPGHSGSFYVANHIRALLDMLYDKDFSNAQGMRKDYIGNDAYNQEIFNLVSQMKDLPQWPSIDAFMEKEYRMQWIRFKEESKHGKVAV